MTQTKRVVKADYLIALAVTLIVLVVYSFTVARTITGEDSGEFIAVAKVWGVAHPPGYPLYVLLAKLATILIPIGTVAFRVNLLSAILGALAAGLLSLLVARASGSRIAGWISGLALGASLQFWTLSVTAEVYTLHALFLVGHLLLLHLWSESARKGYLLLFAFLFGLSATNHSTMIGLAPVFVVYILLVDRRFLAKPMLWLPMLGLFVAGLSPFLLILLRARAGVFPSWSNVRTLRDLVDHVARRQYAGATTGGGRSAALFLGQFGAVVRYAAAQFTWLGAGLSLGGFLLCLSRTRASRAFLWTAVALVSSVGVGLFTNFPPGRPHLSANYQFFLPLNVVMALWIGLAAASLERMFGAKLTLRVALALFPIVPLVCNWSLCNRSDYYLNEDLARNLTETVEEDAVLFSTSDLINFALYYSQAVLEKRGDIEFATPYGPDSFSGRLPAALDFNRAPAPQRAREYRQWSNAALKAIEDLDRPLYFTKREPRVENLPGWTLRPEGLLWRLYRRDDDSWIAGNEEVWKKTEFRNFNLEGDLDIDVHRDLSADWIIAHTFYMKGALLVERGDLDGAMLSLLKTLDIGDGLRGLQSNTGILLAEKDLWREAEPFFRKAARADRRSMETRVRWAYSLFRSGRKAQALGLFDLIRRYPRSSAQNLESVAEFYLELGEEFRSKGLTRQAASAYGEALATYRQALSRGGGDRIRMKIGELTRMLSGG